MRRDPKFNFIDVICQYTSKGDLIPMRIRVKDEDGLYQEYNIRGYKELSHAGEYLSPYGTKTHSYIWTFLCKVQVFEKEMELKLFFNGKDNLWRIISNNENIPIGDTDFDQVKN